MKSSFKKLKCNCDCLCINKVPKNNPNQNNNKENNISSQPSSADINTENNFLCIICSDNPSQVVFAPCGHQIIYRECYNKEKNNLITCSICRSKIVSVVQQIFTYKAFFRLIKINDDI